jgi:hypothetical protein
MIAKMRQVEGAHSSLAKKKRKIQLQKVMRNLLRLK